MNKDHTPGPWRVTHIKTEPAPNNLVHTFEIYTDPNGEHDNMMGLATAQLIEAAPLMLEALNQTLMIHEFMMKWPQHFDTFFDANASKKRYEKVLEALKKAKPNSIY